ncbi:MAG: GNAT family N-acetyltransferase [Rickettsiales bacterium]|nr:MAG: GNAT family N-acetyltransferase [Rickettsiales bacterium]
MSLTHRKVCIDDLKIIVDLLSTDKLGKTREQISEELDGRYIDAFHKIDNDPNQYLMALCEGKKIVGTSHCTLMPSLTFTGSTRMQIEAVRVCQSARGKNIGQQMIEFAIGWGKNHGATIFQLSTNKERVDALRFYEKLGFNATHEGMKLYLEQE